MKIKFEIKKSFMTVVYCQFIKHCLLLSFIFLLTTSLFSQSIVNVDFEVKNNWIKISYDLVNCPTQHEYDIKVKVINEDKLIIPTAIIGDLYKVTPGKGKKIEWDVLQDKSDLKGNIEILVEIGRSYSTKIKGGPSNALLSALVPGLGDKFVNINGRKGSPGLVAFSFYGCIAGGVYCKIRSNDFYNQYHQATSQSVMDTAYKKANSNNQMFQVLIGMAAVIWVADVVNVVVKGSKNRRSQLYGRKESDIDFFISSNLESFQFGIVKKF
jgi:hypothetical protein